ncbi:dihydrodipicolinate reductase C-terminal domain-containing protein [Longispora sp. K20-0274]|uniref:dihydrodipicolinate reductase C-terminal domain-containing protein n=1 Tax=Longispora sp. K20-0274 TaxID=3088255 RepID=UPI00399A9ACD
MADREPGPHPEPTVGVVGLGRLGGAVVEACGAAGLRVVLTASRRAGWRGSAPTVLVDASGPGAGPEVVAYCAANRVALVQCVSDIDDAHRAALCDLATRVAVLRAENLAYGHYVQRRLVEHAAVLGAARSAAASVWERHPATKSHRPSATARLLADTWTTATGADVGEVASYRAGLAVSEHEFTWTWPAESLVLRHQVGSLAAAARGATAAVRWLAGRPAGPATMRDVYDDLVHPEGS